MTGLSSKGIEVFITLSPDHMLIMRDPDYHKQFINMDMRYVEIKDKGIIDSYNAFVCMYAERCVFSVNGDRSQLEQIKRLDPNLLKASQPSLVLGDNTIRSRVRGETKSKA